MNSDKDGKVVSNNSQSTPVNNPQDNMPPKSAAFSGSEERPEPTSQALTEYRPSMPVQQSSEPVPSDAVSIAEESFDDGATYYDEEPTHYVASPYDQRQLAKEARKERENEAVKKTAKSAVNAVATYFGGPVGGQAASIVNNSGVADPIYDKVSESIDKMSKVSPAIKETQGLLTDLDEEGVLDPVLNTVDTIASQGGNAGSKAAGDAAQKAAGKKAGEEVAKKGAQKKAPKSLPSGKDNKNTTTKTSGTVDLQTGSKLSKTLLKRIFNKYPWLFVGGGVFLLLFLLIMVIILGSTADESNGYLDEEYDFTQTVVMVTNNYTDESNRYFLQSVMLEDLVKGFAYLELKGQIEHLSSKEKVELYKTQIIVAQSLALAIGNYDYTDKVIYIKSGNKGIPYCDIDNGCKLIKNNGLETYVSMNYDGDFKGTVLSTIDAISDNDKVALEEAYEEVKYKILLPKKVDEPLEAYTYGNVAYTQKLKNEWIDAASEGESYEQQIKYTAEYEKLKIYDLQDYIAYYTYADSVAYWWPIGGSKEINGVYSGNPTVTYVSSKYGYRTIQGVQSFHKGIDIASNGCNSNVIVATRSGTVTKTNDGCASVGAYGNSCGGGYGNYVIIDHGDGTSSVYAHMYKDSVSVKVGDKVNQGQKVGLMGSSGSSTGCHLHFEVRVNNEKVDPLEYVSASNPRPSSNITSGYAQGGNNIQTVCLSLKQSGFSDNAVAAIMTNIQAESSFRIDAVGDNGTSYGLCQWHNGRYTNLKSYCGSSYSTVKCQLSYLNYELKSSYKGVYNYLLTNNSAFDMAKYYCMYFEIPANREVTCTKRATSYSSNHLNYVKNGCR